MCFLYIQLNIQFLFKITGYFEHIFRLVSFTSIVCVFYYSRLQERKHKERKNGALWGFFLCRGVHVGLVIQCACMLDIEVR